MACDSTLLELLQFIKQNQWPFLGDTRDKYASLTGFIMGYTTGVRYSVGDLSREVFPKAFNDFVRAELNKQHGFVKYDEKQHWLDFLVSEAGDPNAAFDMFYRLWEQFSKESPVKKENGSKPSI